MTSGISRSRLTGFTGDIIAESRSVDIFGNETVSQTEVDRENCLVTQTVNVPDSATNAVTITVNGLVQSSRGKTGHTATYTYDAIGRQTGATDSRTGTQTTHYNTKGQVDYVQDAATNTTWYAYSASTGQRTSVSNALGKVTRYQYDLKGQLTETWGDTTYPVSYDYDTYGRMSGMATYRGGTGWEGAGWPTGSVGTADTTTWSYEAATGLLTNKLYADGKGTRYTYTPDGKLATRTWARTSGTNTLTTTYAYDEDTGELTGINYSDSTPDVTFTYNRAGQQKTVSDVLGTRTFSYNTSLQLTAEAIPDGAGGSNTLARTYSPSGMKGRSIGFDLDSDYEVAYGYDGVGRFSTLTVTLSALGVTNAFTYSYLAQADLLSGYTESGSGLTVTRTFEANRDLLTQVKSTDGAVTISQYDYLNDAIGRRTSVKNSGNAFAPVGPQFNLYRYNTRSELTNAVRYFGADLGVTTNPVLGQAYGYVYDNIGNRVSALEGSAAASPSSYTANNLNQYTEREVAGEIEVLGSVSTGTTVTVNNQSVTRQGDHYWYKDLDVTNSANAVYEGVSVVGVYNPPGTNDPDVVTVESGKVFVAETPEGFSYDDDGNLTGDGRWAYTWNSENRLTQVETAAAVTNVVPRQKLVFEYDYMGRRVSKTVLAWSGSAWQTNSVRHFVYDGWNLISEIADTPTPPYAVTNYYVWGLDLSGSLQGAGGIGGLLTAQLYNPTTSNSTTVLYCYDANGNVGQLVDNTGTNIVAHQEYSPVGSVVVSEGPLAGENPFQFSTKYRDEETGFSEFGYREYSPTLARWTSRDPLEEQPFGENLYLAMINDYVGNTDALGGEAGRTCSGAGCASAPANSSGGTAASCCANPCYIINLTLQYHVPPVVMLNATWTQLGDCRNVAVEFWTCTWQQFTHIDMCKKLGIAPSRDKVHPPQWSASCGCGWRPGGVSPKGQRGGIRYNSPMPRTRDNPARTTTIAWRARVTAMNCDGTPITPVESGVAKLIYELDSSGKQFHIVQNSGCVLGP